MVQKRSSGRSGPSAGKTRDRMVAGAAELLRRRGVTATSLREVVRHTGTPRGSIAHHFPGGKAQLLEEAVSYAHRHVSRPLREVLEARGTIAGIRLLGRHWREALESTGFEAGCPVMAVAIEHAGDDDGAGPRQRRLPGLARAAFDDWVDLLAASLCRDGVPRARARTLAVLIVASFEGAIGMSRAARSCEPLDRVVGELERVVGDAVPAPRRD